MIIQPIVHTMPQGSDAWHKIRVGKITGSGIRDINKLISEILTGEKEVTPLTNDMERGLQLEPIARRIYEQITNEWITEVGFIQHPVYDFCGFSPDGVILNALGNITKAIEIKCPKSNTHVKYILEERLPLVYETQIAMYFFCTPTLESIDFISYCPEIADNPIFIVNIKRSQMEYRLRELEKKILSFWGKVQLKLKQFQNHGNF